MRKILLRSLLVLLTGAPAVLAQDYAPYPDYRPAPTGAWPATFQSGSAAPYAPRTGTGMYWPAVPSYTTAPQPQAPPVAPFVAPAKPPAAPARQPAVPAAPPVTPVLESPREPMLSPLPKEENIAPVQPPGAEPGPPPVPPAPGTPMVCEPDLEQPMCGPPLSHEFRPPRVGPRGYRFYGSADYLFWFVSQRPSPVLLTTGPLGSPGTSTILGNGDYDNQQRSGVRSTLGMWLTPMQTFGLEVTGLWLAQREPTFHTSAPVLARPFVDATTGAERALILSAPGVQTGAASVSALSRLWGGEGNARYELCRSCFYHLDLLGGFRYLEVDDSLGINSITTFAPTVPGLGNTSVTTSDSFAGRNSFYGGQIGMEGEFHYGRFFVDLWGKTAFGMVREVVGIGGSTLLTTGSGVRTTTPGGLLALPTNSGHFSRQAFAVVPEVGINFGLQVTTHLRARVGYTFLYISNIVRGGDQIDNTVNLAARTPGALVGPARPAFGFQTTDFWAQGINAGLEFRY